MKSRMRNLTGIASGEAPGSPSGPRSGLQTQAIAKIQIPGKSCGPDDTEEVFSHPAWPSLRQDDRRPEGKMMAGLSFFFGQLLLCSPSLISAVRVFSVGRGSMRKDACFIDLLAPCGEAFRRLLDVISAAIGLVLTAPLFLTISILIKLDSPGPVIYRQVRVGQNRRHGDRRKHYHRFERNRRNGDRRNRDHHGRLFVIYKFRSMRQDAEKKIGPVHARKGDPRITKVGKFLRATRGDKLPQLFNVLKGDMSLVGPKSERPYFVGQFLDTISRYGERLKVKPGLIGVDQAVGAGAARAEDVCSQLHYDVCRAQKTSLRHHLKMLSESFVTVSGMGGHG